MGHLKRKLLYSNHPFQVRTVSFKEGRSFCFFFFRGSMKAVGSSFFSVFVCQENRGQGANFRSYHWWKCFRVWNLSDEKTAGWPEKPMVIFGSLNRWDRWYTITQSAVYTAYIFPSGGLYATYHLLGVTRNNPLIFHRLCYGSSPQWRSQLRWVFFKFASSGWSFQQMDFCLLSTYFFNLP